ncbi:MAG: RluA family pseudouridine synthase [Bacilli bacterium]|nr:RluA family pseudouridine synthase [Bacilli bacterium]
MIKIIYEDNHLLVVEKPINQLVQADNTKDLDLLTELKMYLKEKYQKPGNVYLGLVHRLDRPVGGVMVFAKTSKAAARLAKQMQENKMIKEYHAVICGNIKPDEDILEDYLLKDKETNMVKVDKKGKFARLKYQKKACVDNLSLIHITLDTGRSHQIRVQFSSRNFPLYGDQRYNKNAKVKEQIALWATKLTLEHPITKESISFESTYPNYYPWNLFKETDVTIN